MAARLRENPSVGPALHQVRASAMYRSQDNLLDHPDQPYAEPCTTESRSFVVGRRNYMLARLPLTATRPMNDVPEDCLARIALHEGVSVGIDITEARSRSIPGNKGA